MRSLLRGVLEGVASLLSSAARKIYKSPMAERVKPWFESNGDKTLRLEYDLSQESTVFDVGGYEGQWTSDIFSKYCCFIHIFEPVPRFAEYISKRFSRNPKISVHRFGLADRTYETHMGLSCDGSSVYIQDKDSVKVNFVETLAFLRDNKIEKVDLMKINIEGGEFDLLEHLIDSGYVMNIVNIQVQFHDFVPNAELRMKKIQDNLSKTHHLTYQYRFVWENWRINL